MKIDPITLEVMRNAFYSIADEMIVALIRASYSTNIKDRRDASCAIYTSTGDVVVVAQSEIGTPLHLGTMQSAVRSAMAAYPFDDLKPGDAVAMNMPYPAGPGHLNDLCLISPVFYQGEMIAITANQAHHVDVGGFAPGSMPFGVREIFQEGLQIPPIRLFRSGELEPELWSLIAQNVRPQVEVKGDLLAQYACNITGARRLTELMERYTPERVGTYLDEMIGYSERRMRAALQKVPKGMYSYEDVIEGDGISTQALRHTGGDRGAGRLHTHGLLGVGRRGAGAYQLQVAVGGGVRLLRVQGHTGPGAAAERGGLQALRHHRARGQRALGHIPYLGLQCEHHHDPADHRRAAGGSGRGHP